MATWSMSRWILRGPKHVRSAVAQPTVPTLIGTGISEGVLWGTGPDSAQRVYILDLGGENAGNIAINVEVCCGVEFEERMAAVTPVIESFAFAD